MAAQTIRWAGMRLTVEGAAEFQAKLKDVNSQLKLSQSELNKVTSAYERNTQNAETLAARKEHLTEAMRLNEEKQKALRIVMDNLSESAEENANEIRGTQTALNEAEAEQRRLERALLDTQRAIDGQKWKELGERLEAAGAKIQKFGDGMQKVGRGLSLAVTAPLMALGVQALRVGADYESSMGTIQARTGMAAGEVETLSHSFRDMAVSGEYGAFTAREIAGAYAEIAVHGQDAAYGTDIMRNAMVLATATGVDLRGAAYFLGNYLLKVGKDASYAEKYINLFAAANQKTGIGLDTLQDYLFRTNASLQTANISGTEATAVFGNLYQAGIRGAQAYSGMNTVIRDLISPSDDLKAIFDELGVSTFDITDANRNALDVLFELADAVEESGDALLRHNLLQELGTDMGTQFADELFNQRDALREVIPELYALSEATDGTGRAFEMAATNQDGLAGSTALMRARFEEMKLQIADQLIPVATQFMEFISGLIGRFTSLDEGTQRTIIKFAGIAAAVGPVLVIGGKLVSTVGKIISAFGAVAKAIGAAGSVKAAFALKFPLLTKGFAAIKIALAATKLAFTKLTAVMLANPIGAIVAGVALLIGGITALVLWLGRAGEEYKQMAEDSQNWLERQREITQAAVEQAAAFEDNTRNMQSNAEHLRNYADRLEELAGKQELTAGEMAEMDRIMAVLNENVDGLNLAFDEQTGALNTTVGAIQEYLAAAEAQAALDAGLAERSRLQREAIDLAGEKAEAERRLLELQEKQEDGSRRNRRERNLLQEAIDAEKEALALLTETMGANEEMQDALTESIDVHAQALEDIRRAQEEAAAAIEETTEAIEGQAFSFEEWEKAQSDAIEKINRSFESYKRIASNAFSTVSENAAISVQEMTANLIENTRAVEEWSKNLAILAERGVDDGLLEQLRNAGPEAAATVRELVAACDDELEELNEAFYNSTTVAVESMQRALDPQGVTQSAEELIDHVASAILNSTSMEDALVGQITAAFSGMDSAINNAGFDGLGENTVAGYVGGINNMLPDVDRAGQDTADTYLDAITGAFDMASPSRVMQKIGVNAGEGLIQGTRDIQPQTEEIARTLATAFINNVAETIDRMPDIDNSIRRQVDDIRRTADSAVAAMNFQSVGQEIANGVARGIDNGGGIVSGAAQRLINNALNAMRAAAAISSPSRKTREIGQQLIDGITGGLASKMGELAAYCERITDKVTDSLQIDPQELIKDAREVLSSMRVALPALESNIHYTTSPLAAANAAPAAAQSDIHFHFGDVHVREESDIEKIVNMALRKLGKEVDYSGKLRGVRTV